MIDSGSKALQTTHEGGGGGHGGHGGGGPDIDGAMALDAAIEVFSDQDMQMLSTNNGRSELKEEPCSRSRRLWPEITTIYFMSLLCIRLSGATDGGPLLIGLLATSLEGQMDLT